MYPSADGVGTPRFAGRPLHVYASMLRLSKSPERLGVLYPVTDQGTYG